MSASVKTWALPHISDSKSIDCCQELIEQIESVMADRDAYKYTIPDKFLLGKPFAVSKTMRASAEGKYRI